MKTVTKTVPILVAVFIAAFPLTGMAFPWDMDMRDQPSVKAQETEVEEPADSVPVEGKEILPPAKGMKDIVFARLAARALKNPFEADEESVAYGRDLYLVHCGACHGATGRGDGPVGEKFTLPPPMDLTLLYVQKQPDGQLYYTITNGGLVMPAYRDAIEPSDRWHIINYLKQAFANNEQ